MPARARPGAHHCPNRPRSGPDQVQIRFFVSGPVRMSEIADLAGSVSMRPPGPDQMLSRPRLGPDRVLVRPCSGLHVRQAPARSRLGPDQVQTRFAPGPCHARRAGKAPVTTDFGGSGLTRPPGPGQARTRSGPDTVDYALVSLKAPGWARNGSGRPPGPKQFQTRSGARPG